MNDLNFFERMIGSGLRSFLKFNEYVGEKTGKSLFDRMEETRKKDEELKKSHPVRWVAKKILQGTIKGLVGGSMC